MQVHLIATTTFHPRMAQAATDGEWFPEFYASMPDLLVEFAGRNCYQSWDKPRPETAKNSDYVANIIKIGHTSLFKHSSTTFYLTGVSRAFLTELDTHTFLSGSTQSQRYVDESLNVAVIPPAVREDKEATDLITEAHAAMVNAYSVVVDHLTEKGLPRKKAREAARSLLPNSAETRIVVSGTHLAWRDFLGKRWHAAADAEMREVAGEIRRQLVEIAPASFQDIPAEPFGTVTA